MPLARFLLFCAVVIWGWTFVATKICLAYLSPLELLGLRLLIALPVMLGLIAARRTPLSFRLPPRPVLLGSALIGIHFYIQITGLKYTSATNTGWIIAVTPVVIALLSSLVLGERISPRLRTGIGVATLGIFLLVSRGRLAELGWLTSLGDWLILASAHTWALYTIAVRDLARAENPLAVTFVLFLPATIVATLAVAFTSNWERLLRLPLEAWLALLFLGVFGMALAHWFWQVGVSRVGAARAGVFLYLEPLATTTLAVPYLGEPLGPTTIAGGGLVLLGVWIAQRSPGRGFRSWTFRGRTD
jgi:drug/metabolite transporter (DMT)-like permease